jgi:protein-S-isoprenylcysteine O-methyltransferase Ste14
MNLLVTALSLVTIVWLAFEIMLVVRDRRRGVDKNRNSRRSGALTLMAMIVGLTVGLNVSGLEKFHFPGGRTMTVFFIGVAIMILGFGIRLWSIRVLGSSFRTTLGAGQGQQLVKHGPYRLVRHPSYGGALLVCCGFGIALQDWLSLAAALGLPLVAYVCRISIEEKMLLSSLGSEYREYQKHTKKLVPWIW